VELDVRPEPDAAEREALARALADRLRAPAGGERTAWWRAGVRENVDEPRSNVGSRDG
jgi:hypothetical protein